MAQILLTTTGTQDPVVFNDLGRRTFAHPTADHDLLEEYTEEELRGSSDLQDAIDSGWVTLTDQDGNGISMVDSAAVSHRHLYGVKVISRTVSIPPGSPSDGDTYIVGSGGTGDWSGHDDEIAEWRAGPAVWVFTAPGAGAEAWVGDETTPYIYTGVVWTALGGGGGGGGYDTETLTYTDTVNKVIGPLSATPGNMTKLNLFPFTGALQEYTVDYTVRLVIGGSAPGYYVCIDPTSTAPGGGAFSGGSNPSGPGIAVVLLSGDKVRTTYPV